MPTDAELLRRYAEDGVDEAFSTLVQRHVNLVYSAALRQVRGDVHRAEEVTKPFTVLAQKAATLCRYPILAPWLYAATRRPAANSWRADESCFASETTLGEACTLYVTRVGYRHRRVEESDREGALASSAFSRMER